MSEARGDSTGVSSRADCSGTLCEWRFLRRGLRESSGRVGSSLKKASRARRVDKAITSHSGQPPLESMRSAWSSPRQETHKMWQSPPERGALHEKQCSRGI